jgi:hypothetical protein
MLEAEHKLKLLMQDRPWETEPDHKKWVDPKTKYKCEVKRNPMTLSLLGYVTVPKKHHYYGLGYNDVMANVHGGLTFSDDKGKFGFDCAHAGDLCPGIVLSVLQTAKDPAEYTQLALGLCTYRTFDWVVKETEDLAKCLHVMDADLEGVLMMQAAKACAFKGKSMPDCLKSEYKQAKQAWLDSLAEDYK